MACFRQEPGMLAAALWVNDSFELTPSAHAWPSFSQMWEAGCALLGRSKRVASFV